MENVINMDYNGCIIASQLTGYLLAEINTTNDERLRRNIGYLLRELYENYPTWMSQQVLNELEKVNL
jgi:hypothetical protein